MGPLKTRGLKDPTHPLRDAQILQNRWNPYPWSFECDTHQGLRVMCVVVVVVVVVDGLREILGRVG